MQGDPQERDPHRPATDHQERGNRLGGGKDRKGIDDDLAIRGVAMKKQSILLLVSLIVAFFSCSSKNDIKFENSQNSFKQFLKKFKPLRLPLTIRIETIEIKGLPRIDSNSTDTLFESKDDGAGIEICYGMLPDTNNYFGLIVLFPADKYIPVLKIYDKSGKKISEESLVVTGCGCGPEIDYCSSTAIIRSDLTIYCVDTLKTVEIDNSTLTPIDSTREYFCEYKEGKINNDGKTSMSVKKTKKL